MILKYSGVLIPNAVVIEKNCTEERFRQLKNLGVKNLKRIKLLKKQTKIKQMKKQIKKGDNKNGRKNNRKNL